MVRMLFVAMSGAKELMTAQAVNSNNLVVQGDKWIKINRGEEYLRLKGIVRPVDIDTNNTISSARITNAKIQYSGEGDINDANSMG